MPTGQALIDACKAHLLDVMRLQPDCAPGAPGLGNKEIEEASGFALHLARADGWLTWSLLVALANDGKVEVIQHGKRNKRYRLA